MLGESQEAHIEENSFFLGGGKNLPPEALNRGLTIITKASDYSNPFNVVVHFVHIQTETNICWCDAYKGPTVEVFHCLKRDEE